MTKKENSKTKENQILESKKALAELASLKNEVEQLSKRAELEKKLGHKIYSQAEVDKLFIMDEKQELPYFMGKERKPQGQPVALVKCKFKKGREDFYYICSKGRQVSGLKDRYSAVPQRPKETVREQLERESAKNKGSLAERYYDPDKKLTKKEVLKMRYGKS